MSLRLNVLILGTMLLCLCACTETTIFTSTWKAPDVQALSPVGKTVAAVFVSRDESQRRAGEDVMAADLTARGARGIAVYTILPNEDRADAEEATARLKQAGVNAVVVMRVVGKDQQITFTPGYSGPAYYNGFGPYWGHGWSRAYDPGTVRTDTLVSVETQVYSLERDKLLWAGTSRTTNPRDIITLVKEAADATAREMVKQGFLAP